MRLRGRITLTTLLVCIPLGLALLLLDAGSRQRAAEGELHGIAARSLGQPQGRAACESGMTRLGPAPEGMPPRHAPGASPPPPPDRKHREPARVLGYSASGEPIDPEAPPIEISAAVDAQPYVSRSRLLSGRIEIILRTPWGEGPCAYAVATGTKEPWLGAILPESPLWLAPLVLMFVAVIVAVGPVVQKLGALERGIRGRSDGSPLDATLLADNGEVGALARAFEDASDKLEREANARRQQEEALRAFLADTTHDVMIPLTVLQGHIAGLRDAFETAPAELLDAMRETHYIASLLHNLGTVAKLDQPEPTVERTKLDLGGLLERVVARHRPIARQLSIELEVSIPQPPQEILADLTLLEQAVSNLVYNAVRYNHAGGHVAVFAETSGDTEFSIHVVDDGPGIPPDDRRELLHRGQRGDAARSRAPGGLGLGLSIVQRVCTLHDYALTLDTSVEGGLHVRVDGRATPSAAAGRAPAT